jgi:M6 family metalloprotease-like protein/uncharacterized repeat protein (TIGR02543 family)
MIKRIGVMTCLVLAFVVQTLFTPFEALVGPRGVMAADGRSVATVGFNTEGDFSRASVLMPPQLRAGGELTVLLTTRGNPDDWMLLGTPGAVQLLSRGWSAADIPSQSEVPAAPGRVNVEFRVRVDGPASARLVLENVQQSGQRFEVTSKPGIGAESLEGLATLTLDAVTPPAPRTGVRKPVVLLVDFADRSPAPASTVSYFQDLLFASTGGTSSMRDYFNDVSYGQLQVAGQVYGDGATWIRLPQTFAYYDSWSDSNWMPHRNEFLEDVRAAADPLVDFSQHDGNGDGIVDGVIIIYAGQQAKWWSKGLWPHSGGINWTVDGVTTDRYTVQAEGSYPGAIDISVFCHEYSHALGAWDFYDYDIPGEGDGPSCGAGIWTLMAYDSKQLMDPFHRYYMGWVAPTVIDAAGTYTVEPAGGSANTDTVFRVNLNAPNEYLLIENRQQTGWDAILPGNGLLIWHVDEGVTTGNNSQWYPGHTSGGHYFAAVEQADGFWGLEKGWDSGDVGDMYQPGGSLTPLTTPTSLSYSESGPRFAIDEITPAGSSISFHLSLAGGSAVSLTAPANGAITPTVTPTLSWQPYAGATSYRVRVASDATLSTLLLDTNTGSSTSFAVPSGGMGLSTLWFWRISALVGDAVVADSPVWSFTTCGDAFEPDRKMVPFDPLDWALAALIESDGTLQHHNFEWWTDEDYVKFLALPGVTYTIDILNVEERVTTQFMLLAPDGTTILDRSNFAESRIDFECPAGKGGMYYVRIWPEMTMGNAGPLTGYDLRVQPALSVTLSNADNADKDYGLTGVTNHVTATVTRNGVPVPDASVDVNSGATVLATDASGQASFALKHDNTTCDLLQVTSGNGKVTTASFWTIEPSDALVSVKPRDVNGYYLTRFYVDTYDLVGQSQWGISYSGASNSLTLPSHVSSSNLAVVTACGENHGGRFTENKVGTGYVFTLNPTLTAGEKISLTPLATTDCVPLSLTVSLDGQPLVYDVYVYLRNEAYDYVTTSPGGYIYCVPYTPADPWWDETVVVYVTPGTYSAVAVQNNYYTPSVWLTQRGISALSPTTAAIATTTSQLGTLACRGMDGHSMYARYNYLYLSSAGVECSLLTTQAMDSGILLSPGVYEEKGDHIYYKYYAYPDGPFDYWRYTFDASATRTVTAGSTESVTFGGSLTTTIDTPATVRPDQSVTTMVTFKDPEGHRLVSLEGYAWSSSPTAVPELLEEVDSIRSRRQHTLGLLDHHADTLPPAEAQGYVYPAPHFLVKDATNSTKVDMQGVSLDSAYWPGYSWTVPADAAPGTWHILVTFDPGVFQDPISADQPFVVAGTTSYTLTVTQSPSAGGTITRSPDQASYPSGTVVTLTATPSPGYTFTGWTGATPDGVDPLKATVIMDGNKTVTALFAINTHTLSTGQVGNGMVSKDPSQASYDFGTSVTLTATPTAGWSFTSWSGDVPAGHETDNPLALTMDGNKTLTATFTEGPVSSLITHYYSSLLARSPDEPGRLYWLSEITRLQSLGIDVREGFIALARLFLTSPEYLARNTTDAVYVTDLYATFFNRTNPDPVLEVQYWTGLMAEGMSRDVTMNWFVYSAEYASYMTSVLGSIPTRPENNLVNDLYRGFLNRLPDTTGFTAQLTAMRTAQALDAAAVRATTLAIALAFQGGPEYALRARTDAQFVEDCYNGILRRGALASEIQYWMDFLAAGHTRAETLTYFVGSPEFQFRVDQVIAAGPYIP